MRELRNWFERAALRENHAVFLEDALFSRRFFAYGYYRFRFFLGRTAVESAIHIVEFVILSFIFSGGALVLALAARVVGSLLGAWWWGALECMRGQFRSLHREGRTHLISRRLPQWIRLAGLFAACAMAATIAWVVFDISRPTGRFEILHVFVLATGLRLSLSLLTRTFHSAVYSIRRVYRPFIAIIGVPILGFVGTLAAWPTLGAWSYPVMLIPTVLLANGLTFVYVRRMYRLLGLHLYRHRLPRHPAWTPRYLNWPEFWAAGSAYASTRLDELLLLAYAYAAYRDPSVQPLLSLLFVISPFMRASSEWAQLAYFDLKRLELALFVKLKRRFERFASAAGLTLALVLWAFACLCATAVLARNLGEIYPVLLALFIVLSQLALHQIRAFAEARYFILLATGALVWLLAVLLTTVAWDGPERVSMHVLALLSITLVLAFSSASSLPKHPWARHLALPDWIAQTRVRQAPTRIRGVQLAPDVAPWLVERLKRRIASALGSGSAVTLLGDRRLMWSEVESPGESLSDRAVLALGAGHITHIQGTPFAATGVAALDTAQAQGLFDPLLCESWNEREQHWRVSAIRAKFAASIPDGIAFDPTVHNNPAIDRLSPMERRQILHGAVNYSKQIIQPKRSAMFDVTALFTNGEIRLIFAVPLSVKSRTRTAWRRYVNRINLSCAFGAHVEEEERPMLRTTLKRYIRRTAYVAVPIAAILAIPVQDRVTGSFELKASHRGEVRAPVAGFLQEVVVRQGDSVDRGTQVARLEIPDLETRIAGKRAEILEVEAQLQLLEAGTRPEALTLQSTRVRLAKAWRDSAKRDLRQALDQDVQRLDGKIEEFRARLKFARENFENTERLYKSKAVNDREFRRARTDYEIWQSQYEQALAERRAREALVVLQAQSELIEREEDVAEAQAELVLMRAGTRPEKLDMERARLSRLNEELRYLDTVKQQLWLHSPVSGVITTGSLEDNIGRYYLEGDLMLEVEDPSQLAVEISVSEDQVARAFPGQKVVLKALALPYRTFETRVDRISPVLESDTGTSTAKAHCAIPDTVRELRPGMSGYARIYLDRQSAGRVLWERFSRFMRTEFFW